MSISRPEGSEDPASIDSVTTRIVDPQVQLLLQAVSSDDGETIASEIDRLGDLLGPAAAVPIRTGLEAAGLTNRMLTTLTSRAKTSPTAVAWTQLASAAAIVGNDDLAVKAAGSALKIEPAGANAALILVVTANRHGNHDEALRLIADLVERLPAAKEEPFFIIQTALAQLGLNQPQAALASVDAALPRLTAVGLEFDALVLRARALSAIEGRGGETVKAWESALAGARFPQYVNYARGGLIAALRAEKRYDESLYQLDLGIGQTSDLNERAILDEVRLQLLAEKGDIEGSLAAAENLLTSTSESQNRVKLRLLQARIAAHAGQLKEAVAYFDAALNEFGPDSSTTTYRRQIQLEKVQTLAPREIDLVLSDIDELVESWPAPEWPLPIDMRVGGLLGAGRPTEALDWLDALVARTPSLGDHPAIHQLRAEIEIKLGRTAEAMAECQRAMNLAAAASDPRGLGAVLMCAYGSQQWTVAIDAYKRLNQMDPASASDPSTQTVAAVAYLRHGDAKTALKLTDGALPVSPTMVALRDVSRGEAQFRLGQYDAALATTDEGLQRYKAIEVSGLATTVPVELPLLLHTLRAQTHNQQAKFPKAVADATAAIEIPDNSDPALPGLTAFVRLGAFMQRSLALHRLGKLTEAEQDINKAIDSFQRLRRSSIANVMQQQTELERFESGLWYAKGAVLDAEESRSEEALAAYTRADRLEKEGNAAAIARGYALAGIGAFKDAMASFDTALARASSPRELAGAVAGKGRVLVHLGQFEEAIVMLHDALDAHLDDKAVADPVIFEALGIAYNALNRFPAARRAFLRAWNLAGDSGRSANLALGVTSAELCLGKPQAALNFLKTLPAKLAEERALQFNRALALNALGHRHLAINCLVKLKDAGLREAQKELDRLDVPAGLGLWSRYWLGIQARPAQRRIGKTLLLVAAMILLAPLYQWRLQGKVDWYLLLVPSVVALLLFALPNLKSISMGMGEFKVSAEPLSATDNDAATPSLILPSMLPPTAPAPATTLDLPMHSAQPVSTTDLKVPALDSFPGIPGFTMPLGQTLHLR